MIKINFKVETDDGWPPVSSEGIWCDEVGDLYKICNSPFFVKDIAFGDVVRVGNVGANEAVVTDIVERSGNSTVWLHFRKEESIKEVLAALNHLGCGYEGGGIDGYFSVNVPESTDMDDVVSVLSSAEDRGDLFVAYPADRH